MIPANWLYQMGNASGAETQSIRFAMGEHLKLGELGIAPHTNTPRNNGCNMSIQSLTPAIDPQKSTPKHGKAWKGCN